MITRISPAAVALLLAIGLIAFALSLSPQKAISQTGTAITGWLWSDTIGWISMNCSDTSSCGTSNYSVAINTDGTLTGYAWSDNVGWVRFGGLSSFPTGDGTTAANASLIGSGTLTGWARACAGTVGGDCSSMTSRSDGWDGWIALSDSGYGPTLSGGHITGYSWGSTNSGWILWDAYTTYQPCANTTGYQCVADNSVHTAASCEQVTDVCASHGMGWFCSNTNNLCTPPPPPQDGTHADGTSGELSIRPSLVQKGQTAKVHWNIENVTACTVTGNGDSWSGSSSPTGGYRSSPITQRQTYTLSCTGNGGTLIEKADVQIIPEWRER